MMKWILPWATILLVAGTTVPALACTCFPVPLEDAFESTDLVCEGLVLSIDPVPGEFDIAVQFMITKVWKGDPIAQLITVFTAPDGAACGVYFEVDRRYVLFGMDTLIGGTQGYYTHLCTYTTDLEYADDLIDQLSVLPTDLQTWGSIKAIYK